MKKIDGIFKDKKVIIQSTIDLLQIDVSITKGNISEFLIRFFRCIEDVYGEFGELGIDFAIDKQWRVWFIGCNAKPGKDIVYLSYDNDPLKKCF